MRRAGVCAGVGALVVALSACGSDTSISVSGGVIHIGRGVPASSLTKSVLGIKIGTDATVVRSRLGNPVRRSGVRHQTCWWYRADQGGSSTSAGLSGGSSLDGLGFCMSPQDRVARIVLAMHL